MNLIQTSTNYLIADEPISESSVRRIYDKYHAEFAKLPKVIKVSPEVMNILKRDFKPSDFNAFGTTFYGMRIQIDPDLKPGEYRIGDKTETVKAL